MKAETMFYIALGTVSGNFHASDVWAYFALNADSKAERVRGLRNSIRFKTHAIVGFDREMDRLIKEYK